MSNLLNNKKKKLLDRGPKITPTEEFKLGDVKPAVDNDTAIKEKNKAATNHATKATSVRVTTLTRQRLNALIQLGVADNMDVLIDILMDEYIKHTLTKDEQKSYDIILDILRKRDK